MTITLPDTVPLAPLARFLAHHGHELRCRGYGSGELFAVPRDPKPAPQRAVPAESAEEIAARYCTTCGEGLAFCRC